jgi:D-lyxose ketol-isomerase
MMMRSEVEKARDDVRKMLTDAGITLGPGEEIEITDFGKENYEKLGLGLIIRSNEAEYASKWLTVRPGQVCPNHYHKIIKETFFIINGDVTMVLDGVETKMKPGDKVTLGPGTWHEFWSEGGAVIEEVTTHQEPQDSYFEDETIQRHMRIQED